MSRPVEINDKVLEAISQFNQPVATTDALVHLKAVIYGDGGAGKTILSCRFGKTLLFSTDEGWAVTKNKDFPFELDVTKVEYQGPKHLAYIAKALRMQAPGFNQFDTITIDTISGFVENYLDIILTSHASSKRPVLSPKNPIQARQDGIEPVEVSGFDDYNAVKTMIRPIIRDLIAAPVNVFFIAHEKELDPYNMKKDGSSGKIQPDLPDKVYKLCLYDTHILAHMTRDGKKRELNLGASPKISGKSRIQALDGKKVSDEEFIQAITNWRNS